MLVSGRFELQFSIPFPFPFHRIKGGFGGVHAHNFSWKRYVHVHEKYPRNVSRASRSFFFREEGNFGIVASSRIRNDIESETNRLGIIEPRRKGRSIQLSAAEL